MIQPEISFIDAISEAIDGNDQDAVSSVVSDFSSFTFKEKPGFGIGDFSVEFVAELLRLIERPDFLQMEGSFRLLLLFQNDWGRLSPDLRSRVCRELELHYKNITDHASHLVIVELLGEYSCDDEALDGLDRLQETNEQTARAHVAHGYGLFVKNTRSDTLKARALSSLRYMTTDRSAVVSQEAASILARLGMA